MQSRHSLLLSLIFATMIVCAGPAWAQNSHQNVPAPSDAKQTKLLTVAGPYRLTYTLTEMDGEKRLGSQHYAVVLDPDGPQNLLPPKTSVKVGTKVPIVTGSTDSAARPITYIDVGLRIDASLRQFANGLELRTHVTQSALESEEPNSKDPVIRQTDIESSVLLHEDKPVVLGTLATPGSTHRLIVQVELIRLH